jgi:hypothetical protein
MAVGGRRRGGASDDALRECERGHLTRALALLYPHTVCGGGQRLRVMRGRDPMWRRAKQCDEKPVFPGEDTEIACFASAAFHK